MAERASSYKRDPYDWYCEPAWTVEALASRITFLGAIHDPCCGMGTIPETLNGTGADLIDRGYGYPAVNFLDDHEERANIVTNPPYEKRLIGKIIDHAFAVAQDRVAILVQLSFLASQSRWSWFENRQFYPPLERVIIFSRRPSMPPGEMLVKHGEEIRKGGSKDYCWIVWRKHHRAPPIIEWAM